MRCWISCFRAAFLCTLIIHRVFIGAALVKHHGLADRHLDLVQR